jgi:hypothetical protein
MDDGPDSTLPGFSPTPYLRVLDEARQISQAAIGRLRELRDRFPSELPADLVGQVERIHDEPADERRQSPRLRAGTAPAVVAHPSAPAEWDAAAVLDRSVGGLALLLGRPTAVEDVLLVWLGDAREAWLPVQVRHCRKVHGGWEVGVAFIDPITAE